MVERKPPGMRHETWIEKQIREAQERGEFDNLPGAGKPIKGLDRPFTAERWALAWIEREGGDLSGLLPPLVALRKERSAIRSSLSQIRSEEHVRDTLEDFNQRLLDVYRRPIEGPMVPVGVFDVEETVAAWREQQPAPVEPEPEPGPERRRWWRTGRWIRG